MFEITQQWHAPEMEALLKNADLLDIEAVSQREFEWFEAPNKRRGGWSGVSHIVLNPEAPEEEQKAVFLKIQQNHFYVSWRNYYRKRLTYEREFIAINHLDGLVNGLPQPVLYAQWKHGKNHGCVLITLALNGWLALDQWLAKEPADSDVEQVLRQLAATLRRMHQHRWAHFGLFQKHVFLHRAPDESYEIKLIDFEKARKTLTKKQSIIEDVSRFLRHSLNLKRELQIYFLHAYFQTERFTSAQKALIRKMRGAPPL